MFPLQIRPQNRRPTASKTASGLERLAALADDERNRDEDHGARGEHLSRDLLAKEEEAESDRDQWVHIGVGRDERRGRVAEKPDVSDEADEGPDDDEIGDRPERVGGWMKITELTARRTGDEEEHTAAESGEPGGDERPLRKRRAP